MRLSTFRKMEKFEEAMIRAVMPKTSARSSERLNSFGFAKTATTTRPAAPTTTRTLTYKMSEAR